MRSSFLTPPRDLISHGEDGWQIERSAKAFSETDQVLTINGTQDFEAVVKNTSSVEDGHLYMVTLDILSLDAGKLRVQLGDAVGEWRKEAGMYSEVIKADGTDILVVGDPNCVAEINLARMSVRRK